MNDNETLASHTVDFQREQLIAALAHDYKQELADLSLDELKAHAQQQAALKGYSADWWANLYWKLTEMKA